MKKVDYAFMMQRIITVLIVLTTLLSCGNKDIDNILSSAEARLDSIPEIALEILQTVDRNELTSRRLKARHALLHSIALDKNYIDLADDSIIAPAVEYYRNHGNLQTRFKCHYYEARIYENAGDLDNALLACSKAEALDTAKVDAGLLCLFYAMKGRIYDTAWRSDEEIQSKELARKYAYMAGKYRHYAYYSLSLSSTYNILGNFEACDNCISDAEGYKEYFTLAEHHFYNDVVISRMIELNKPHESILQYIDDYIQSYPQYDDINWKNIARAYLYVNMPEKALEMLSLYSEYYDVTEDAGYYSILSRALTQVQDYQGALNAHEKYALINDTNDLRIHNSDLKLVEERYSSEMTRIHQRQKFSYLIIVMSLILMLSLYFIFIWSNKYIKNKADLEDLTNEYESLKQLECKLNETYRYLSDQMGDDCDSNKELLAFLRCRIKSLAAFLKRPIPDALSKVAAQIDDLKKNKNYIVDSIGLLYAVNYPDFVSELQSYGLTSSEIGYCCLYILGLNMPEVGEVIGKVSSIYNINSTIRKKLKLPTSTTNLDKWLVNKFSESYSLSQML